jgi:Zn-dependent metalloprotease
MAHGIVPPYLLLHIARLDEPRFAAAARAAANALRIDEPMRSVRLTFSLGDDDSLIAEFSDAPNRTVSDADNTERLPGRRVRGEGEGPVGDLAVDEAYDGLGSTFAFFSEVFGRNSIDGLGLPLDATVHFGDLYDNAFWNGERMVFGDGDGEIFGRFTASLTVIGHELAHGITQYGANLEYRGQSGALNESLSDVFGALVEQYALGQTTAEAGWLIGAGLFTDQVEGAALRNMKAPGTAYDDDVLGKDPQPAHMDDFIDTEDDNGGVHLNSGIPNRAFVLAAEALGGSAWEVAGRIWFDTLAGELSPTADFAAFAAGTVAAADAYGEDAVAAVRSAWEGVGVRHD